MKPAYTLDQMVDLLYGRGLLDGDRDSLKRLLLDHNYYRLSGYFRQFQVDPSNGDDSFQANTTLTDVMGAYDFDSRLSNLIAPCVRDVECLIRSRFAYHASHEFGPTGWFLDPASYGDALGSRDAFTASLTEEIARDKSAITRRYVSGNDLSRLPIWVAVEVMSFGSLSKMLMHLDNDAPARKVADSLSFPWALFPTSIQSISVLRNRVAHHSQIWHRRMIISAPINKKLARTELPHHPHGPYPTILAIKQLLKTSDRYDADMLALESFLKGSAYAPGILTPAPK